MAAGEELLSGDDNYLYLYRQTADATFTRGLARIPLAGSTPEYIYPGGTRYVWPEADRLVLMDFAQVKANAPRGSGLANGLRTTPLAGGPGTLISCTEPGSATI